MDTTLFLISLACAIAAPILAIAYLRSILHRVLSDLCHGQSSAEFWIRCTTLLSTTGSVLLLMLFGDFDDGTPVSSALRRCLVLTMAAVFASVAIVSRTIWSQARLQAPVDANREGAAQ